VTSTSAPTLPETGPHEPPFPPALVEELLKLLGKAARAHQLYLQNNPVYQRAIEQARAAFAPVWARTEELVLQVTEGAFVWEGRPVLEESEKSGDSLPWLFYKDGLRELRLLRGFEGDELVALLAIVQRARKSAPDEDDLLTLLWEKDFLHLRYRYVDLVMEAAPSLDAIPPAERAAHAETMPAADAPQPREGIVNLEDFDATLYFLDEHEIEYLRSAVQTEYSADLRVNVLAMLLDVFELQTDAAVREEASQILENLLPHLLSAGQFRAVAYLLRESATTLERARNLADVHRTRLRTLPDRLSEPAALSQLLQSLDEAPEPPAQEDLNALFEQLRPSALGTVFAWLGRAQDPRLRQVLETAAGRLASQNTAELVRLIGVQDREVALEAARRAGALRSAAAVAPLGRLMQSPHASMRLAAVQALVEIGSPGAMQQLERGVEDADRDVRVASSRAIAARTHRAALPRIEALIKGKIVRDADLTEKMTHFEAYGALCGEAGIPLLDELLNGKSFFGRKEDTELRACAAMALGRVASPRALELLRQAQGEKEVLVRNAVNRALRAGGA
jgi:HEAT repeat protein